MVIDFLRHLYDKEPGNQLWQKGSRGILDLETRRDLQPESHAVLSVGVPGQLLSINEDVGLMEGDPWCVVPQLVAKTDKEHVVPIGTR